MTDLQLNNLIYKTRVHILEMINDRGFNVNDINKYSKDELILLLEQHKKGGFDTSSDLSALDIYVKNNNSKLIIKYRLDEKFKKSKKLLTQIDEIYDKYSLTNKDCLIILNIEMVLIKGDFLSIKNNNVIIKFINNLYLNNKFVQIYGLENFLLNISHHKFVPKHNIIKSKNEINEIVKKFHTSIDKLPKIYREDAMAKYIGAKPKDIIKIKGFSETSGFITKYRYCVDGY